MNRKIKILFLLVFFAIMNQTVPVSADEGVVINPQKNEIAAKPGQKILKNFIISNQTGLYVKFRLVSKSFRQISEDGKLDFFDSDELPASSWLIPQYEEIILKPFEAKEINFIVNVPRDLKPGGYYGAILFYPPENSPTLHDNFGELVLLTVSDKEKASATANNIRFWTGIFQQGDPVNLNFRLSNSGNTHFNSTGKIAVKNWQGKELGGFSLGQLTIYPGTSRLFKWQWNDAPKIGLYRADIYLTNPTDSSEVRFSNGMWFFIFPWQTTMIILLPLVLFFLIFKVYKFIGRKIRRPRTIKIKIREASLENLLE